jgi:hypothetical protein
MTSTSVAGSNPSSNTTLTTSNVQLQMEPQTPGAGSSPSCSTTLTMSNLQLQMKTHTAVCGPSQSCGDGLANIITISDDLHSDLQVIKVHVQLSY